MLQAIFAAIFATAIMGAKPIAKVIGRIAEIISAKKEEEVARKAAMERYLTMDIMDIEH